jgi:hypothetical protein
MLRARSVAVAPCENDTENIVMSSIDNFYHRLHLSCVAAVRGSGMQLGGREESLPVCANLSIQQTVTESSTEICQSLFGFQPKTFSSKLRNRALC